MVRIVWRKLKRGVAGFGDSPAKAAWDFDKQWAKDINN